MSRFWIRAAVVPLVVLSGFGCGKKDSSKSPPERRAFTEALFLDDKIVEKERRFLTQDLENLNRWQMSPYLNASDESLPAAYEKFFGAVDAPAQPFLASRVKSVFSVKNLPRDFRDRMKGMVALNYGSTAWVENIKKDPEEIQEWKTSDGRVIARFDSTRSGVIVLGDAFQKIPSSMYRVSTLVHEGRHSDCPGGVNEAQLAELRRGDDIRKVLGNCSFTHVKCPPGHDLENEYACDLPEGWGAYAAGAVYAKGMYEGCTNCSEIEKSGAMAVYLESAGRVSKWSELMAGKYGLPDMRHSGYVGR